MGPSTKRGRKGHEKRTKSPYSGHEVDAMRGFLFEKRRGNPGNSGR